MWSKINCCILFSNKKQNALLFVELLAVTWVPCILRHYLNIFIHYSYRLRKCNRWSEIRNLNKVVFVSLCVVYHNHYHNDINPTAKQINIQIQSNTKHNRRSLWFRYKRFINSDFCSSTRGERNNSYYANHSQNPTNTQRIW